MTRAGRSRLRAAATTDVGRCREHNEDAFLVRIDHGLFVVADGMGGHESGDVASAMVASSIDGFFEEAPPSSATGDLVYPAEARLPKAAIRLLAAVRKANRDVHLASLDSSSHRGMGSTVVAIHFGESGDVAYIGHVGDSRCYRIRSGHIELLTEDHSLVNEARAMDPSLTEEDLARLPTNIITRALGLEREVQVDLRAVEVLPKDVFLLCSDGLSGLVSSREMVEAVRLADDLEEASELLVALANEEGGYDNITALVVAANG
ncbi:MAG: serine/threonine-protein phosphatase [Deltaproteobacteria bacterium]|nr:serine/threonine-protein phosphatase [Deltaproteobacteria bacterium]